MVPFGVGTPPLLVVLVRIGMFTGGTIWILTHGHVFAGGGLASHRDGLLCTGVCMPRAALSGEIR